MTAAVIDSGSVMRFPVGVRLQHDRARERWVLLAPERVLELDEIAHSVLTHVDGRSDVEAIVAALAREYGADAGEIYGDVIDLFSTLLEKRMLAFAPQLS
ncbi:pyrroloquinoline quinone biosynthesis peptide chaperone PqqD [Lysobacter enzymogenes]|uniref:pyrroloquinoline quinone biosynthesis peptide chaperone PqqD n=1 Tax=Lysobacter enzymogenes TaxID=69 RepID=UPI001A97285A|nr:pyrroloquinoline quinone biosynthesis peptide chaperone PqqD [Lysobacter enzymogenes]QQP98215.1 pyrroloquinoline quinone biosynthesis peptide chaperone PqqD [Lysobacter enzymogenes]